MGLNLIAVVLAAVAFKDAAKIKSWDSPVMIVPTSEVEIGKRVPGTSDRVTLIE